MEPEYPIQDWFPLLFDGTEEAASRSQLVISILGHRMQQPTYDEIEYVYAAGENRTTGELQHAIGTLIEAGILTTTTHPDNPEIFIGFTDEGKQFLYDMKVARGTEVLLAVDQALERTDEIQRKYELPRPDHTPANKTYEEREEIRNSEAFEEAMDKTNIPVKFVLKTLEGEEECTVQMFVEDALFIKSSVTTPEITSIEGELTSHQREKIVDMDAPEFYTFEVSERDGRPELVVTNCGRDVFEIGLNKFLFDAL